ncbi:MAG TPA: type II toxin-antitoxin system RelE/ParE family toxin [Rhizomicrobium sp.]
MACIVEYSDTFGAWWETLTIGEQEDVAAYVGLLEARDVRLGFPHSSGIAGSRHSHMRELRVQSSGKPIRVFYAFDPRRMAILLLGGDKTGNDRFYATFTPVADRLYDEHLEQLRKEGLLP